MDVSDSEDYEEDVDVKFQNYEQNDTSNDHFITLEHFLGGKFYYFQNSANYVWNSTPFGKGNLF